MNKRCRLVLKEIIYVITWSWIKYSRKQNWLMPVSIGVFGGILMFIKYRTFNISFAIWFVICTGLLYPIISIYLIKLNDKI